MEEVIFVYACSSRRASQAGKRSGGEARPRMRLGAHLRLDWAGASPEARPRA